MADSRVLSVLVIDDDDNLRSAIALNLEASGYSVSQADSAEKGCELLKSSEFNIILCDMRMPGESGIDFIDTFKELNPDSAIIMMTAFGNNDLAVKAMRAGAYDYLSKPFEMEELVLTIRKVEERERLKEENKELRSEIEQKYNFSNIVARSKAMADIFDTVKRLSKFNTTILITGESGTGKELLAKAIHHNSPRDTRPFVAVNCGAIPENLIESELFGHKKGAFTDASRDKKGLFEEASGGTIFLDEIAELPLHLQVKILRVLQEQQIRRVGDERVIDIDTRVIAATLKNLEEEVDQGNFRDDLYYRLNVVSIHIPPLRERPEDISVLVKHFINKHNRKLGLSIRDIDNDAMKCLLSYNWRGNIRELENCIERAMVLTDSDNVDRRSLPDQIRLAQPGGEGEVSSVVESGFDDGNLSIKQHSRSLEIRLIRRALEKTKGNRTHAAKELEISHRALLYKMKEYGIS